MVKPRINNKNSREGKPFRKNKTFRKKKTLKKKKTLRKNKTLKKNLKRNKTLMKNKSLKKNLKRNKTLMKNKSLKKNLKRNKTLNKYNRCNIKIRGGSDCISELGKKYPYLLQYRQELVKLEKLSAAAAEDETDEAEKARYLAEYKEIKEELNRIVEKYLKDEIDPVTLGTIKNAVLDKYGTMWDSATLQVVLNRAKILRDRCLQTTRSSIERRRECIESNKPQSPLRTGLYDYDETFCELIDRNRLVKYFCKQNKGNADCEDVNKETSRDFTEYTSELSVQSEPPVITSYENEKARMMAYNSDWSLDEVTSALNENNGDVNEAIMFLENIHTGDVVVAPSIGPGLTTVNQSADRDDSTVTYDGSYQEQARTLIQEGLLGEDVYWALKAMEGNIDKARDIIAKANILIEEGLPAKDVYWALKAMEGNIDKARDIIEDLQLTPDYSAANPLPVPPPNMLEVSSLDDEGDGERFITASGKEVPRGVQSIIDKYRRRMYK